MVRKKRTGTGESSGEASGAPGQGSSQPAERAPPQQHGGGGGRGWVPQQGGRGGGQHLGRGGGQYQGHGGPAAHRPGGPPEYQPRDYQGRGHPGDYQGSVVVHLNINRATIKDVVVHAPRGGGMPQPYYGGHRGTPEVHEAPIPEVHEAPPAATNVTRPKVKMAKKKDVPSSSTAPGPSSALTPSSPKEVAPVVVPETTSKQFSYTVDSLDRIEKTLSTLHSRQEAFEKKVDDKFFSLDKSLSSIVKDVKANLHYTY